MANEEGNNKASSSSNLKVPPLKIVLSSYQNNTIANISNSSSSVDEDNKSKSAEENDNGNDHIVKSEDNNTSRRNGSNDTIDGSQDGKHGGKKNPKNSSNDNPSLNAAEACHAPSNRAPANSFSSSSSSSSSTCSDSDASTSTTPSSESLASNSTIIADHQQSVKQQKVTSESKEETATANGRQERVSRYSFKVSSSERPTSNSSGGTSSTGNKRTAAHDNNSEQPNEGSQNASTKEHSSNANQRITRSSQRAAQQNKSDNSGEPNNDDSISENQSDKVHESARKAKRRKGEPQECELDSAQTAAQLTVTMANIFPADYQLPAQNSFELYRDIRKRPYKKLMKLSHAQPKVPHGFKDYLLNAGPYLLDGNKLGVGLNGSKFENPNTTKLKGGIGTGLGVRLPLRMKLSNLHHKMSQYQSSQQRHSSYKIPKPSEAPKSLQVGSPLYELFKDQEKARHQMRMQHLKERERAILAAEQEILRAYNRAAIADKRQKLHLSACTYFYYQERYHYLDERSDTNGNNKAKEIPHNQDNSFLCIEGGDATTKSTDNNDSSSAPSKESTENKSESGGVVMKDEGSTQNSVNGNQNRNVTTDDDIAKCETSANEDMAVKSKSEVDSTKTVSSIVDNPTKSETEDDNFKVVSSSEDPPKTMSDEDLKVLNKEHFIGQLQEIDDKWDDIKRDMLVRHKNESDSLLAVQTLEWEWKAKEIGAHDVRVPLKIEPECVPRVEVTPLDY